MPPGVSKSHVKKRKAPSEESEEREDSEEQHEEQSLVAGRQRRTAATKSHHAWDTLKPGAKPNLDVEDEVQVGENSSGSRRARVTPKRTPKNVVEQPKEEFVEPKVEANRTSENAEEKREQFQNKEMKQETTTRVVQITASRSFHRSQQQPAMNKDQLELIEQEMETHDQFVEPDEREEVPTDEEAERQEESAATHFVLDDPDDEDYNFPSKGKRGAGRGDAIAGRGRGGRGGVMPRGTYRGRPRGSRAGAAPRGGGVMRGRVNVLARPPNPMGYYPPRMTNTNGGSGIYSLQPTGGIIGELSAARTAGQPSVVRILRPAGVPVSNFQTLRPASMTIATHQQQIADTTSFEVNQELQNYRGRIVAGSSVQEFNDIIDQLLAEYQRAVDDRSRLIAGHREYVNHLKLTHQAAQEIKDSKIRQLEQTVDQLQQKLVANFKQKQLQVVKQGSVPTTEEDNKSQQQPSQQNEYQQEGNHQQIQQGVPRVIIGGSGTTSSGSHGQPQQSGGSVRQQNWPMPGHQQRFRMMGMDGDDNRPLPQLHNQMGYFDDEMDDEDDFDDEEADSAEMDEELGAQVTI